MRWPAYIAGGLALAGAFLVSDANDDGGVCVDGMCLVPERVIAALVRDAELAREYARMCGWIREDR